MTVGRAALHTLEQIVCESDLQTQEKVIETLEANLARHAITRTDDKAVPAILEVLCALLGLRVRPHAGMVRREGSWNRSSARGMRSKRSSGAWC